MKIADWIKSAGSRLADGMLSPASMYQLGEGVATSMYNPKQPALVPPAQNPYAQMSPGQDALRQLQAANLNEERAAQDAQMKLVLAENLRDTARKARMVNQFRAEQAMQYNGSGVQLRGTPLLVLEETRKLGQQEIDAMTQRSIAQADLMRRRANIAFNEGKARLLGGELGWNDKRAAFDLEEQARYTVSQIRRNTGTSRMGDILSSLSGLLPGYSGMGRVRRNRYNNIPQVPIPAPITPPLMPDPAVNYYYPPAIPAKAP